MHFSNYKYILAPELHFLALQFDKDKPTLLDLLTLVPINDYTTASAHRTCGFP